VGRIIDRLAWRNRLLRIPLFATLRHRARSARQAAFTMPEEVMESGLALIRDLRDDAAHIGHIADLLGSSASVLDSLGDGALATALDALGRDLIESEDILHRWPAVYMLGLEERLLRLAELYLGEPCYFLGISMKRERVSPIETGARQWHLDIEDDRMLRLLVYLNDVDEGTGPFTHVPATESAVAHAAMGYRGGYIPEARFGGIVPPETWRTAQGRAGTLVAFDGTRIFHRAGRPTERERLSLSLTWSSRHPRQILRPVRLRLATRRRLLAGLNARQRACIPPARWS